MYDTFVPVYEHDAVVKHCVNRLRQDCRTYVYEVLLQHLVYKMARQYRAYELGRFCRVHEVVLKPCVYILVRQYRTHGLAR